MRHLTVCEAVMREKGKLTLNAVQCMLSGHPRVGKSTLLARLIRKQPSIQPNEEDTTKESQESGGTCISPSTGVLNAVVRVTVKKVTMVVAMAVQPGLIWEQIEFDVEAIALLKSVTKDRISHSAQIKPLALEGATKDESTDKAELPNPSASTPAENEPQSERSARSGLQPLFRFGKRGVSASSTSTVPGFKTPLDIFKEALKSEKWGEVEAFIKDSLTIYFTDTGGQPEFQEVLPALISGPALFFLVFKLIDGLNQRYQVQFVSPSKKSKPYMSSFTVKETLLQSLASIASTCSYASYTSKKMVAIKPHIVLVGTHEDKASEAEIRAIQQELKETLEKTEYCRHNILVFASEDEPVVTVNNISSDGRDTDKIREIVERIAKHPSFHIEVPLPWLVSSLAFRLLQVPVISYDQCASIASECGIDTAEELNEALWFLHHKVGFIRYFESVPELRDVVILNPQLLFDKITELISSTFTFKQVGYYAAHQFREIGMFALEDLMAQSSEYLNSAKLVKLLEHLHIIAPIRDASGEVEKYFMPCVLTQAAPNGSIQAEASRKIPPLLVTFRCGYCPKGIFSALIVHLMSKHNNGGAKITWRLKEKEVSRDRVTFKVGREDSAVTISTHLTHLDIAIESTTQASANLLQTSPHEVCKSIRQCIDEGVVTVSQTLHYDCDSAFNYGFYCTHPSCTKLSTHLAVCYNKDPVVMECSKSEESCDLPDNCRVWFGHPVSNIF